MMGRPIIIRGETADFVIVDDADRTDRLTVCGLGLEIRAMPPPELPREILPPPIAHHEKPWRNRKRFKRSQRR